MYDFEYARPATLDEATKLLADNPEARPLSGGQTLIPALKQRLNRPALLVDLQAIDALRGIEVNDEWVSVGAMTRHAEVAAHPGIAAAIPALAFLAGGIADPQVRHQGTIGGSISNNDPAADYPSAVVGLGAQVVTTHRVIAADDFFTGLFSTVLEHSEIVTRVRFARPRRAGYCKLPNPASGYVMAGCFIAQFAADTRVAVNGAGPCVFRQRAFEEALSARFELAALEHCAQDAAGLNADMHASAAYRAQLVKVAAKRALARALQPDQPSCREAIVSIN
ncbi:xanthine dehydrogenase family protein subunit M [Paraburkholderia sp. J63]|uniref:FAD binding domain-containing protein n=1 Tax=Paraburkholderia sp. J63 TaxID=2805434 RepID=UPI002ABE9F7F|nr:xanthine dehydrogenase family protein subunit M [Paraburkholderia sp. J63]